MSWALDQDWTLLKRARDMSRAYEIGLREAPAAIYAETSYHVEEFLAGLLPALLQLCIVQALATAIGAGIGAGLGALVFGAGAIPGAAVGAEAGFDLGLIILGWLGLAFLAAAIAHSLGDVVTLLKHAVVQAWRAADAHEDERRQQVRQAGQTLARAMAVLVRLILQGIVAWLLKRGIDKAPELIAELKASRLGVAFGEWVEKNLGRLVNDPKLRGHAGEGTTTKVAAESTAQTPSQLAKKPPAEETPPPKPKPTSSVPLKDARGISASEANQGFEKPPFKEGSIVTEGRLTEETKFVRLYDGENSGQLGRWVMPESEVRGLTPAQIQAKFALPQSPQYITEVQAPAGTLVRMGEAGPISGWGPGGGTQVQLMDRIPASSYANAKPYP
ncbi:DUF6861 domain-containing protein [Aquabacterium sp.]|uniref:DUF6861 domain-containing protein n=1 Tax=Aquabacterium sp. TaxID=1872578 RepID=UPI0035B17EF7